MSMDFNFISNSPSSSSLSDKVCIELDKLKDGVLIDNTELAKRIGYSKCYIQSEASTWNIPNYTFVYKRKRWYANTRTVQAWKQQFKS